MKKVLFLLFMAVSACTFSQVSGDMFVGAGSQLSGQRITDLSLSPVVGYQINNNFQIGVNASVDNYSGNTFDWYQAYVKFYPTDWYIGQTRSFAAAHFGASASDDYSIFGVDVGTTAFLNSWFYLEPSVGWQHSSFGSGNDHFGFNLACGLRL